MEAFVAICSIFYLAWPLILFIGIREFFSKQRSIWERLRQGMSRIFLAWLIWGLFLGFIYWQGSEPILLFPRPMNHLLFGGLGIISGGVSIAGLIHQWRKSRIKLADARTLEALLALSPEGFERLVAELFISYGHQAEVAGGISDHGVDVIVQSAQGEKWVVQCKRYAGSVGEPVVRDLFGTLQHEEAQRAYLVTTGSFTAQAQAWAKGKPIVLYDGELLVKLIRRTVNRNSRGI
jgi:hypothetical protein